MTKNNNLFGRKQIQYQQIKQCSYCNLGGFRMSMYEKIEVDNEWVQLIQQAKEMGLKKEDILSFFNEMKLKRIVVQREKIIWRNYEKIEYN